MSKTRIVPKHPALILEEKERHLIVTDLHLGFENTLVENDIFINTNTTLQEILDDLYHLIDSENPDSLVLLGDVKASLKSITKSEWDNVPKFFEEITQRIDTVLVPGNHDGSIQRLVPDTVTLTGKSGLVIDNTLLTHGHALPSENLSHIDKIIMGHLHPVFFQKDSVLNGQRVWISLKTKKENLFPYSKGNLEIIIIPSFNKYFYATNKRYYKKSISPIIENIKEFDSAKIVTLDGSIIGDESLIECVLT